ncbi:MAG: hypothetical protein H6711_27055 [Myxococcales bacterium]|nr:hypothetical protein [Myxococcales bacterium]
MTSETGSESGTSTSTSTGTSAGTSMGATGSESGTGTGSAGKDMSNGALCSLILQDCPMGQKCVPYNMSGGIFPDGVKCVDEPANPDAVGENCQVTGGFGSGEDTCVKGALCFDLDNDGEGVCIEHCSGTPDVPFCEKSEQSCVTFFDPPVPLCFTRCDPLVQDCPEGEGCYMDAPNIGSEGFVCMPTVLAPNVDGKYGDLCFNQAGCAPGFSCIYPENVPGCKFEYCCSPWCDLVNNPEICAQLDPTMACVPWYEEGKEQPGFENVGICGIPL